MKPANCITILTLLITSGFTAFAGLIPPPNLIIILTDNQGYHDVGFNGSKDMLTPNLDSIASNGVQFTSGYIASEYSSPSRAGLLTGRYPERFGYEHDAQWQPSNSKSGLPLTETTLADALGEVGYESGIIGEWHLGNNSSMHPLKRGFHEFFGFLGAGLRYLPEELTIDNSRKVKNEDDSWRLWILRNYQPVKTTNYLTDELSDEAVRFIARHKGKPFFLLLAYNAPHSPLETTEKYLSRFPKILSPNRRTYAAMMSAVDDGVGRVLTELRKNALVNQTMVAYLSISSGALDANSSDNYPLRGSPNFPWEGGWRVPFVMQWPGHLPKGLIFDQPVLSLDIFATIAALAKAPIKPGFPLDGTNLYPYLIGMKTGAPHDVIFLRMPERGAYAVRSGEFKLVVSGTDQPPELYHIATDISELKNIAKEKPEIVKRLQEKHLIWSQQMMPPVPLMNNERNLPQPIDTDAGRSKTGV